MKNAIICLCALLLAVGLFFVLFVPSEPGQQLIPGLASSDPKDRTVLPEFSYNPETIESGTILEMVSFHGSVPEFDPAARKADACIEGRVENIYYTFSGGTAWTQADIYVTRCVSGSLSRGDIVSVYFPGGYVSAEDYSAYFGSVSGWSDCFLFFPPDVGELPLPGQEATYYLAQRSKDSSLPVGAYEIFYE